MLSPDVYHTDPAKIARRQFFSESHDQPVLTQEYRRHETNAGPDTLDLADCTLALLNDHVLITYDGQTESLPLNDFIKKYGASETARHFLRTLRDGENRGDTNPPPETPDDTDETQPTEDEDYEADDEIDFDDTDNDFEAHIRSVDTSQYHFDTASLHLEVSDDGETVHVRDRDQDLTIDYYTAVAIARTNPDFDAKYDAATQAVLDRLQTQIQHERGQELASQLQLDHDTFMITSNYTTEDYTVKDINSEHELTSSEVAALASVDPVFAQRLEQVQAADRHYQEVMALPEDGDWLYSPDFQFDPATMHVLVEKDIEDNQTVIIYDDKRRASFSDGELPLGVSRHKEAIAAAVRDFVHNQGERNRDKTTYEGLFNDARDLHPLNLAIDGKLHERLRGAELPHAPEDLDLTTMREYLARTDAETVAREFGNSEYFRLLTVKETGPDGQEHYRFNESGLQHFLHNLPASQGVRFYGGDPFFRRLVADHPEYTWRVKNYDKFISERPERDAHIQASIDQAIELLQLKPLNQVPPEQRRAETLRTAFLVNQYLHDTIRYDHAYMNSQFKFVIPTSEQESYEMSQAFRKHHAICTGYSSCYQAIMDRLGYPCVKLGGIRYQQDGSVGGRHAYVGVGIPDASGDLRGYIFDPTAGQGGYTLENYSRDHFQRDDAGRRAYLGEDFFVTDINFDRFDFTSQELDPALVAQYQAEYEAMKPSIMEEISRRQLAEAGLTPEDLHGGHETPRLPWQPK